MDEAWFLTVAEGGLRRAALGATLVLRAEHGAEVTTELVEAPLGDTGADGRAAVGADSQIDLGRLAVHELAQLVAIPQLDPVRLRTLDGRSGEEAVRDDEATTAAVPRPPVEQLPDSGDAYRARRTLGLDRSSLARRRQDEIGALVEAADALDLVPQELEELDERPLELGAVHGVDDREAGVGRKHAVVVGQPIGDLSSSSLPPVDVTPMGDPGNEHELLRVVDRVDDPVVADADPVVVPAGDLHRSGRPRLACEPVDRRAHALPQRPLQPPVRPHGLGMQSNVVHAQATRPARAPRSTGRSCPARPGP